MGGFCGGGGGSSTSSRSAGRGSGRGKSTRQTVKSAASSLATDIKMGLSTFGQSKEQQAQTFRDEGYSERAIQSYQDRTAASMARALAEEKRTSKDDKPAAVTSTPEPEAPTEPETPTTPTPPRTPTPPPPPPDIGTTTVVDTGVDTTYRGGNVDVGDVIDNRVVTSETEAETIESTGKGRRSTIATSPKGLLGTGGATRPRRSLVGGGLIK
jgi:hypothetical protein